MLQVRAWDYYLPTRASGNLSTMTPLTPEAREAIALGWFDTPLSQTEYARQAGIAPRTLRLLLQRRKGLHGERQEKRHAEGRDVPVDAKKIQDDLAKLNARVDKLQAAVDGVLALLAALEKDFADRHAAAQVRLGLVEVAETPLECAVRKDGFGTGMPAGASLAPAKAGSAPKGEESTNGDVDGVEQEENQPATAPEEPASATAGTGGAAEVLNLPHLPMPFPRGWNVPGYFHQF